MVVDVSVPGGKWAGIQEFYPRHRVAQADKEAAQLSRKHPDRRFQVIDAEWYTPARTRGKAVGLRTNAKKSIKGLKISGHRWRDSYGNTYHRAYITVNGRHVGTTPISYGYGHHYLQTAKEWLKGHGYRKPSGRMSTYDAGYDDVKRKKDL